MCWLNDKMCVCWLTNYYNVYNEGRRNIYYENWCKDRIKIEENKIMENTMESKRQIKELVLFPCKYLLSKDKKSADIMAFTPKIFGGWNESYKCRTFSFENMKKVGNCEPKYPTQGQVTSRICTNSH